MATAGWAAAARALARRAAGSPQWLEARAGGLGWPTTTVPLSSHLADPEFVAYLAIGFVAGLAAIYLGAKQWRVGKLLENTASERIRSVAVGRTEVDGTCRDVGITFEQPYADGDCVYRHWSVAEERSTGNDSDEWVTVAEGTDVAPFFVEDDTGRMLVDTTEAPYFEISSTNSYETTVAAGADPPPEVQSFDPDDEPPGGALWGADGGDTDAADGPDDARAPEQDRERILREHVDDAVLNDDGSLREDVTAAQLQQAVADTDAVDVSDFFAGRTGGPDTGTAAASSGRASGAGSGPSDPDPVDVDPEAIVGELGGLGEVGDMGTGSSLARRAVGRTVGAATGGYWGSAGGDWNPLSGDAGEVDRSRRRRYTHEVLPVGEAVYVFGAAEPRPTAGGANEELLKLGEEPETGQFIVSDRSERGIQQHFTNRGPGYVLVGLLVSTGCLAGLLWMLGIA